MLLDNKPTMHAFFGLQQKGCQTHDRDLASAFDWSCCMGILLKPIRSTTQIWVVMHHQHGISALVSQTSFRGETISGVIKCQLFSQATKTTK